MPDPIVLYDLRIKRPGVPISLNTWKARYTLNVKGLEHKTTWLYITAVPDEAVKLGVPKTGDGIYTVPMIFDPAAGRATTDSLAIAEYLDKQYPDTPTLLPAHSREAQITFLNTTVRNIIFGILPITLESIFDLVEDRDKEYFRTSREKRFGKKLEEITPKGEALTAQLKKIEEGFDEAARAITERSGEAALFFGGQSPVFADIALVSVFKFVKVLGGDEHIVIKLVFSINGGRWARFAEAFSKWDVVN